MGPYLFVGNGIKRFVIVKYVSELIVGNLIFTVLIKKFKPKLNTAVLIFQTFHKKKNNHDFKMVLTI